MRQIYESMNADSCGVREMKTKKTCANTDVSRKMSDSNNAVNVRIIVR